MLSTHTRSWEIAGLYWPIHMSKEGRLVKTQRITRLERAAETGERSVFHVFTVMSTVSSGLASKQTVSCNDSPN